MDENLALHRNTRLIHGQFFLSLIFLATILITAGQDIFFSRITEISEVKNYSSVEKRDIYSTFDSEDKMEQGLPLDPFELMDRLKQAETMNNATTPSDALDEALNAFDQLDVEYVPNE